MWEIGYSARLLRVSQFLRQNVIWHVFLPRPSVIDLLYFALTRVDLLPYTPCSILFKEAFSPSMKSLGRRRLDRCNDALGLPRPLVFLISCLKPPS